MVAPLIKTLSLYHWFPDDADEVRTTLPPEQKVVGVVVETVGVAGNGFTVTVVPADAALEQVPLLVITV